MPSETRKNLPKMEGAMARWYDQQRRTKFQLAEYRRQAADLTAALPDGASVLEVAPGPGYLAIEIARQGRFTVSGLDVSVTFVDIERRNAREAGVAVDFRHGDVHHMPFDTGSFDLVVCQAAFKNFGQPVIALNEMYRVLRPGGTAVIHDMSRKASRRAVADEVGRMDLSAVNAFVVRGTLGWLRLRAASEERFHELAALSRFGSCVVRTEGILTEVRLTKPAS